MSDVKSLEHRIETLRAALTARDQRIAELERANLSLLIKSQQSLDDCLQLSAKCGIASRLDTFIKLLADEAKHLVAEVQQRKTCLSEVLATCGKQEARIGELTADRDNVLHQFDDLILKAADLTARVAELTRLLGEAEVWRRHYENCPEINWHNLEHLQVQEEPDK